MNYNRRIYRHIFFQISCFLLLTVIDQITKQLAASGLKGQPDIQLIPDFISFHYVENSGAAFGIFEGRMWLFYLITALVLCVIVFFMVRIIRQLKCYPDQAGDSYQEKTVRNMFLLGYILMILSAGAVGNLIDRLVYGYVIDFLEFEFISFPVFNFADICVTISCILVIIFVIFIHNDDDNFKLIGKN